MPRKRYAPTQSTRARTSDTLHTAFIDTGVEMLHTINPRDWLPIGSLEQPGNCPQCGCTTMLGDGTIFRVHYENPKEGLQLIFLWFCSTLCILDWEQPQHMEKA